MALDLPIDISISYRLTLTICNYFIHFLGTLSVLVWLKVTDHHDGMMKPYTHVMIVAIVRGLPFSSLSTG